MHQMCICFTHSLSCMSSPLASALSFLHLFTPSPLLSAPIHTIWSPACQFIPGKGPGGHGSLWIEECEGHIKVLDIRGVCGGGVISLGPQLEPFCDWIDCARAEGGKVLVHCRVGVSRSATVTVSPFSVLSLGL